MGIHRKPVIEALGPVVAGRDLTLRIDLLPDTECGEAECGWTSLEVSVDLVCDGIEWPGGGAAATGSVLIHADGRSRPFEATGHLRARDEEGIHVVAAFTYNGRHSGIARRNFLVEAAPLAPLPAP